MKTSYKPEDVIVLLKDITGELPALSLIEREKRRQQGVHFHEMLPLEYYPSKAYMKLYYKALNQFSGKTAYAIQQLADKIITLKDKEVTLVSLARTGTPIGILLKRYILKKYNIDVPHYTISIIPEKGIDHNAMQYILGKHEPETIQFVDAWATPLNYHNNLAVLADPAHLTNLYGTREDFLIPSACLGCIVSGLFSITILNSDVINENDFHGATYFEYLEDKDISYEFIDTIEKHFDNPEPFYEPQEEQDNLPNDTNYILKLGIGETTRSLFYTTPLKILVRDLSDINHIGHIIRLAQEKQVPIEEYPLKNYRACGVIKRMEVHL